MSYQRVSYTTVEGKQSAAYWDAQTQDAWDVFNRQPVALLQDQITHMFSEWVPKNTHESEAGRALLPPSKALRQAPMPVTVRANINPLMIIPAGLFGLACIWLELTFRR